MGIISQTQCDGYFYHHSFDEKPASDTFSLHCHNQFEVYYFIKGEGYFFIEGSRYTLHSNNILLMRPGEFHCFNLSGPCAYERCALHFDEKFLPGTNSDFLLLSPFNEREPGKNNLIVFDDDCFTNIFSRLDACQLLPEDERALKSKFILGELLTGILGLTRRSALHPGHTTNNLVNSILDYINQNITTKFNLDDLSDKFFISKYHLSRIFKKYTGVSIHEYILRKKVLIAEQLIRQGKKPGEAADYCNFGDYSSFYRSFRRITGSSPTSR